MQRSLLALGLFLVTGASAALAQAGATASRAADIQVGGGFTTAASDYTVNRIRGFAFYGDIDVNEHFGAELGFHQLNDPQPTQVYERTYEVGARYHRQYGIARPYVKLLYGRGVFNFPQSAGNLAYNMMVGGAGVDFRVHPRISVRADFEYQDWFSGPGLSNGLRPSLLTFGAAYHIPPGVAHGRK